MTKLSITYAAVAAGCGLLLLILSLWPGPLHEAGGFLFASAMLWLPLLFIGGVLWAIALIRLLMPSPREAVRPILVLVAGGLFFLVCLKLISWGVPLRVSFWLCRPAFEPLVADAPLSGDRGDGGARLERQLGLWWVDRYGRDPRGGVYFRIAEYPDFGADGISVGFAWRPNTHGTPFGNARLDTCRITSEWYLFDVSDDW